MGSPSNGKNGTTSRGLAQVELGSRGVGLIVHEGLRFKDLDKDGQVAPYEDWRRSPEERTRDLLGRMTLLEKAGVMMHGTVPTQTVEGVERYDRTRARRMIAERGVNSFITRLGVEARCLAEENNALQELAEGTRLGIPATVSTDPRNHFQYILFNYTRRFWRQDSAPISPCAARDARPEISL